jgi:flagellar motility protein MotE (MotC chaperone)
MKVARIFIYLIFVTSIGFASSLLVNVVTGEEDTTKSAHKTDDHAEQGGSHDAKGEHKTENKAEHKTEAKKDESGHRSAENNPSSDSSESCLVNELAIEDLKKSKAQIEVKEKEIAAKESEIKVKEEALKEELKKLEKIREEIDHLKTAKKKEEDQKVSRLTETVLTMSPRAASKMFVNMDEKLAVDVMLKMDTDKLAKVLGLMDPVNSSRLSELMAGVQKKVVKNSLGSEMKGGEQKNGRNISHVNEQQPRNQSKQQQPVFDPKQQAQQTAGSAAAEKDKKSN